MEEDLEWKTNTCLMEQPVSRDNNRPNYSTMFLHTGISSSDIYNALIKTKYNYLICKQHQLNDTYIPRQLNDTYMVRQLNDTYMVREGHIHGTTMTHTRYDNDTNRYLNVKYYFNAELFCS